MNQQIAVSINLTKDNGKVIGDLAGKLIGRVPTDRTDSVIEVFHVLATGLQQIDADASVTIDVHELYLGTRYVQPGRVCDLTGNRRCFGLCPIG